MTIVVAIPPEPAVPVVAPSAGWLMANSVLPPPAAPADVPSADVDGLMATLVLDEDDEMSEDPVVLVAALSLSRPRLSACSPSDILPTGLIGCVGGSGEFVAVGEPQDGLTGTNEVVCGWLGRWSAIDQSGSSQCQMAVRWR